MPDVHAGKGCTIGTTMTVRDKVVPNIVGVDIVPVKNAISHPESSGFVEGNNKFKLIKRIVYGRSGLVNLSKKCKLAFMLKDDMFTLSSLI